MTNPVDTTECKRRQMIAEAAYFRAERYGFSGGDPLRDWCEAEAEVDALLRQNEPRVKDPKPRTAARTSRTSRPRRSLARSERSPRA